VKIKFWGTRGSIPTPSTSSFVTSRYGGNTTCVSVQMPGRLIILDAGSGLRNLGLELSGQSPIHGTFFFSHVHWDHIQGFPFFIPNFDPDSIFDLYGRCDPKIEGFGGSTVAQALLAQQQSLNFPVSVEGMGAQLNFYKIDKGGKVELAGEEGQYVVTAGELNHPGSCYGYRIEEHGPAGVKVFTFATDHEHGASVHAGMQALAKDADVLFYDAQYSPEQYEKQIGWGHSTWIHGLREAEMAKAKWLLLTHHDPLHDDWTIARLENDARRRGKKQGIRVDGAREGMEIDL